MCVYVRHAQKIAPLQPLGPQNTPLINTPRTTRQHDNTTVLDTAPSGKRRILETCEFNTEWA